MSTEKAARMYCIMTILLGLHGSGLLTCGIIAFRNTGVVSKGIPYFLGGFIVGALNLLTALLYSTLFSKASTADNELKKGEIFARIQCTCCLSVLNIVGCCLGLFAAFGFNRVFIYEYSNSLDDTLANVIGVGCILAVLLSFFSVYVSIKYMYYFDVVKQRNDRTALAVNYRRVKPLPRAAQFRTTNPALEDQINQLEAQNLLLQQQLVLQGHLQQQLLQQQQQIQTGLYPSPPPPPPSRRRPSPGFSNRRMHQPRAPPPSYYDVKYT